MARRPPLPKAAMALSSSELGSACEACNHRQAEQIVAREIAIGGDPAQFVAEARALLGIPGLEIPLVADAVLLHVFERHQPPLPVVAIELMVRRLATPHPCQ